MSNSKRRNKYKKNNTLIFTSCNTENNTKLDRRINSINTLNNLDKFFTIIDRHNYDDRISEVLRIYFSFKLRLIFLIKKIVTFTDEISSNRVHDLFIFLKKYNEELLNYNEELFILIKNIISNNTTIGEKEMEEIRHIIDGYFYASGCFSKNTAPHPSTLPHPTKLLKVC